MASFQKRVGKPGDHRRIVHAVVQGGKTKFQAPCCARVGEYPANPSIGTYASTDDKSAVFLAIKGTFDLQPDGLDGGALERSGQVAATLLIQIGGIAFEACIGTTPDGLTSNRVKE